jgi:hypothetical protein
MGIHIQSKLNQLQKILPEGFPVDSSWLQRQGYSRQLIAKYLHNGWLVSPVRGVYLRESTLLDQSSWEPVIISLQKLLDLPVTVGGRTALELHGHLHYLSMQNLAEVHLYGMESLPAWVNKLLLKQSFVFHSTNLFKLNNKSKDGNKERKQAYFTNYKWGMSEWTLVISTPERAILELLDELPSNETFHQADVLMEGLTNLRPKYLDIVLSDCRSIKTKRLFLWFAKRHNHAWFKEINTKKINLGSGKRMLVSGGKLDSQYLITVPREFVNDR